MINFRYSIDEILANKPGRTTYLASDSETGKLVVLKEFRFGEESQWQTFKLFEREAHILKSLDHPFIPKYLDYFETETGFCLVTEYIDAVSLQEKLDQNQTFSETQLKQIATKVLEECH